MYQPDSEKRKYGNLWTVTFANQELGDAMEAFLADPESNWKSLTFWIREKLNHQEMTRKELMKWMGCGSDKKKITKTSFLTRALNDMIELSKIAKLKIENEEVYFLF